MAIPKEEEARNSSTRPRKRGECELCGAPITAKDSLPSTECARCGYARVVTRPEEKPNYRRAATDIPQRTVTLRFPLVDPASTASFDVNRIRGPLIGLTLTVPFTGAFFALGPPGWAVVFLLLSVSQVVWMVMSARRPKHAARESVIRIDSERIAVARGEGGGRAALLLADLGRIAIEARPNLIERLVGPGTGVRRTVDAVVDDAGVHDLRDGVKAAMSRFLEEPANKEQPEATKNGAPGGLKHDVVLSTSRGERVVVAQSQAQERAKAFVRILRREVARAWRRGPGAHGEVAPWTARESADGEPPAQAAGESQQGTEGTRPAKSSERPKKLRNSSPRSADP